MQREEEELHHGGRPLSSLADSELRRSAVGDDDEDVPDTMDEIIQQGRLRKEEAAREREELERQRGDLDKEFSDIRGELSFRPTKLARPIERVEADSYDKLLKEFVFDRKATATERTKTPEEIAREKAEKLEALERQRLARADGLADDLDVEVSDADGDSAQMVEEGGEEEEEEEELEEDAAIEEKDEKGEDGAEADDEDDKLGENCIKLMTAIEAEKPHRNYMKNTRAEEPRNCRAHFFASCCKTCLCKTARFVLGRNKKLLGAKGIATRNKKLLVAPGIATRNKDATRGSWPYY